MLWGQGKAAATRLAAVEPRLRREGRGFYRHGGEGHWLARIGPGIGWPQLAAFSREVWWDTFGRMCRMGWVRAGSHGSVGWVSAFQSAGSGAVVAVQ